jgi:LacI family transcriptional regulator
MGVWCVRKYEEDCVGMTMTIYDVAKKANVSKTTVWRVINNEPNVKEETRITVINAIKELDYEPVIPSMFAQTQGLDSKSIGFFVDSSLSRLSYDPFYSKVLNGVCVECERQGYEVKFLMRNEKTIDETVSMILQSDLRALILLETTPEFVERLLHEGIKLVVVNDYIPGCDVPTVLIDDLGGGRKVVEYLLSLGHRRIGFVGGFYKFRGIVPNSFKERLMGYEFTLRENGISVEKKIIILNVDLELEPPGIKAGYLAAKHLLSTEKVDAIFAANDVLAIGVAHYAAEVGINIPGDLSVVGFDNITSSEHLVPTLTTVNVPKEKMGIDAVRKCIDMIEQKEPDSGPISRVSTKLIIRNSCAPGRRD